MKKPLFSTLVLSLLCISLSFAQKKGKTITLFDSELSNFEKWIGVPHETVEGLPAGTYQSANVHAGTPLGLNNDIKNVFSTIEENGEVVLKITGEIYGGLTTKASYQNYHLSVYFKWGEKKWAPRLNILRDNGILYHAYGAHGRFWKTWKTSLEYQVQETDMGDFISIGGNTGQPKVGSPIIEIKGDNTDKRGKFNINSKTYLKKPGYVSAYPETDLPNGQWNHLELYVVGNNSVHVVNGEIVMVVENAKKHDGTILNKGQIQIQSEAAECYYKQLTITGINKFPKKIRKQIQLKK
ncbi:DUF1080 domain-containing protein [Postechiella marina]|uniref:DUF1080 domain-containing protein n=1 Tax=Postechiella marina TaxID=943941 RepID=A0ABP8C4X4_9FLAO